MRPVCATFFAALLAILCAPAPVMAASAVTLVLQFDQAYSAQLLTEMEREVASIVRESGIRVAWRLRADVRSSESFESLVVVHFRGACTIDLDAAPDDRRYYAFTYVSGGAVLPFSEVECDKIGNSIRTVIPRRQWGEREALLGRALGRVLAHELFHMLAKTQHHAAEGVTKSDLSPAQLIADKLGMARVDLEKLR